MFLRLILILSVLFNNNFNNSNMKKTLYTIIPALMLAMLGFGGCEKTNTEISTSLNGTTWAGNFFSAEPHFTLQESNFIL
jgi:hypothetical protein